MRRYLDVLTAALVLRQFHAGEGVFPLREGIRAVVLRRLQDALEPL